jgi:hypothetical protein
LTVEKLIEELNKVEDKSLPVIAYIIDYAERREILDVDFSIEGSIELNAN